MRKLWERYRNHTLNRTDHDHLFRIFCLPYLVGVIVVNVFIDTEISARSSQAFNWAVGIFSLPFFSVFILISSHSVQAGRSALTKWVVVILSALVAAFFAWLGGYYFFLANAITGSRVPVMVSGPVVEMKISSGRWAGTRRNVTIRFEERNIAFFLAAEEYSRVREGDIYGRPMMLGGLGYYYMRGRSAWK